MERVTRATRAGSPIEHKASEGRRRYGECERASVVARNATEEDQVDNGREAAAMAVGQRAERRHGNEREFTVVCTTVNASHLHCLHPESARSCWP
jgi:hypothetical protein